VNVRVSQPKRANYTFPEALDACVFTTRAVFPLVSFLAFFLGVARPLRGAYASQRAAFPGAPYRQWISAAQLIPHSKGERAIMMTRS